MPNRDAMAPETGAIWPLFLTLWLQKLETFISYQGGAGLFIALLLLEHFARSL
jgi:hypothetical protein